MSTAINASPALASILDRIDRFLSVFPQAEYGPAHIVLSDYNLDNRVLAHCLRIIDEREFDELRSEWRGHTPEEILATTYFLQSLRDIPEEEREAAEAELRGEVA